MNVRKNHMPWIISAQLKHPHGLRDFPQTLYLVYDDVHGPIWCEDMCGDAFFYGTQEDITKLVEFLNKDVDPASAPDYNVTLFKMAAEKLENEGQEVLSVRMEQVILAPTMQWDFKNGRTTNPTLIASLHSLWGAAYDCFKAAVNIPLTRRKDKLEYEEKACKMMRDIDDSIKPTILN